MVRPIFFCHIPKTAGSSLRAALEATVRPFQIMPDAYMLSRNRGQYPPLSLALQNLRANPDAVRLFRGHYPYGLHRLMNNPVKVAVLREPVSRVISSIKQRIREGRPLEFLLAELDAGRNATVPTNVMTRYLGWPVPDDLTAAAANGLQQTFATAEIPDPDRLVEAAKVALESVDILGVMEHLHLIEKPLADLGANLPAERVNAAGAGSDLPLTPGQRSTIERLNALDTEVYRHACSLTLASRSRQPV